MSATLCALLGYVTLALGLVMTVVGYRTVVVLTGQRAAHDFPRRGYEPPAFMQRVQDAHSNVVENLPVAAAVLLAAIATGQTAITDALACGFLAARLAQSAVHVIAVNHWMVMLRVTFFLVQIAILLWWILKLAQLV